VFAGQQREADSEPASSQEQKKEMQRTPECRGNVGAGHAKNGKKGNEPQLFGVPRKAKLKEVY